MALVSISDTLRIGSISFQLVRAIAHKLETYATDRLRGLPHGKNLSNVLPLNLYAPAVVRPKHSDPSECLAPQSLGCLILASIPLQTSGKNQREPVQSLAKGFPMSQLQFLLTPVCVKTVSDLIDQFWPHALEYYRKPDGSRSKEVVDFEFSFRPLLTLCGDLPVENFGPKAFKAVRHAMIDSSWLTPSEQVSRERAGVPLILSRRLVNQRMGRVKHLFKWGVEEELVPPSVFHGLLAVQGLKPYRSLARETSPVKPVPDTMVEAARRFLTPQTAAMVNLQLLTAMRPGEVTMVRTCDLDMTGRVWIYKLDRHKTAHHGHSREIYIGPKSQEILQPFLKPDPKAFLFSPFDAREERYRLMRANRKSRVQPSQICRRRTGPKRLPGERYTTQSYHRAITHACDQAFPLPEHLARKKGESKCAWWRRLTVCEKEAVFHWRHEHRWHPHQLRHNAATNLRKEYGIELARIILGHSSMVVTEIYAELDRRQAMAVIGQIG
jgi:integrase